MSDKFLVAFRAGDVKVVNECLGAGEDIDAFGYRINRYRMSPDADSEERACNGGKLITGDNRDKPIVWLAEESDFELIDLVVRLSKCVDRFWKAKNWWMKNGDLEVFEFIGDLRAGKIPEMNKDATLRELLRQAFRYKNERVVREILSEPIELSDYMQHMCGEPRFAKMLLDAFPVKDAYAVANDWFGYHNVNAAHLDYFGLIPLLKADTPTLVQIYYGIITTACRDRCRHCIPVCIEELKKLDHVPDQKLLDHLLVSMRESADWHIDNAKILFTRYTKSKQTTEAPVGDTPPLQQTKLF